VPWPGPAPEDIKLDRDIAPAAIHDLEALRALHQETRSYGLLEGRDAAKLQGRWKGVLAMGAVDVDRSDDVRHGRPDAFSLAPFAVFFIAAIL
jgi:hypothetical protein